MSLLGYVVLGWQELSTIELVLICLFFIKPLEGIKDIAVPIQVKSSLKGFMSHYIKYPLSTHPNILVIIVNGNYSDDNIKDYMIARLTEIRKKEACN